MSYRRRRNLLKVESREQAGTTSLETPLGQNNRALYKD